MHMHLSSRGQAQPFGAQKVAFQLLRFLHRSGRMARLSLPRL
jgi:hypothetical protein